MPRRRKGPRPDEDANSRQLSEIYRSKLRQLDCRKNKEPNMSERAKKTVSFENKKLPSTIFKQYYRKGRKPQRKHSLVDVFKLLKKPKATSVDTAAANSRESRAQIPGIYYQKLRPLDCRRDRELETQNENQIAKTDIESCRKQKGPPSSNIENTLGNLKLAYNVANESKKYIFETIKEEKKTVNDTSTVYCRKGSLDQYITQDDNEIFSPEYSPIRDTEEIKKEVWLKASRAELNLSISTSDKNKNSEGVRDCAKYIPIENPGVISYDPGIPLLKGISQTKQTDFKQEGQANEVDLRTGIIQEKPGLTQIERDTLDNFNSSTTTTIKEISHFATPSKNLLTEKNKSIDLFTTSCLVEETETKLAAKKVNPLFRKVLGEHSFGTKNSLHEKKGCLRYFDFQIVLEHISNKDERKRESKISFSYHEFPIPIIKPIQIRQLPAEFTLSVEKYFFIRNCPVVKCLSYLHRFPHSSPTNIWTFLCPAPAKIHLPNFIFISTAPTPLPLLYNKELHQLFQNFMNIYSELKVGHNFVLLNLLTGNKSPVSTPYPLRFSAECENIISTALFNQLGFKINKARPTVIMETKSIGNSDFGHPCLFQKFGNFKFVSLNIMPDVISENLGKFPPERQVSVSIPFTVQRDSCSCMLVERKVTPACPIKAFLLTLTNNIRFIQSLTHVDSTTKPLESIYRCALQKSKRSSKSSMPLKFKKRKITRNPCKFKRLKKQISTVNVKENIALSIVKRKKRFQATEKNTHKAKRLKTQTMISFEENIVPLTVIKEKSIQTTLTIPHKLKYSVKKEMKSINGNMPILSPAEFSQSISPEAISTAQLQKLGNLFAGKSFPPSKSKNSLYPLVSNSENNLSTHATPHRASKSSKSQSLLRTLQGGDHLKSTSAVSMVVDENRPLSLVKKSKKSIQAVSKHSAATATNKNKNIQSKQHSGLSLKNVEDINFEAPINLNSNIPNDILEYLANVPPSSQTSAPNSNFLKNIRFAANDTQTSTKTAKTFKKSDQISKQLINAITTELNYSKSLSSNKITLSDSHTSLSPLSETTLQQRSAPLDLVKSNLLGFMEVHFFEPIKGRNPNWSLAVSIPKPINTIALKPDQINIHPNAILSQSLDSKEKVLKTFLHVRKITSIKEIESFIFDHAFDEIASSSKYGFDKQAFIFQPSYCKKMAFTSSEFESLRRLNDSFLPKGMYLLTPVRKNGAREIEIYRKLRNKHLSELKTEIGVCYNLGTECVEVEDLLTIPDHLFLPSNVQLTDIF